MNRHTYNTLSRVLLHSFLLLAAIQIFTVVMLVGFSDFVYGFHSQWFPMSRETFTITGYAFLGLMKIAGITLFLVPWMALRLNASRIPE